MRPIIVLLELGCSTPTPPPSFVYFLLLFCLLWGPQALLIYTTPSFWRESLSRHLWVCGQHCVDLRNWAPPMCDSHPLNTCFKLGNGTKVKVHFLCLTWLRSLRGRSKTRARHLHLLYGLSGEADCQRWTLHCEAQCKMQGQSIKSWRWHHFSRSCPLCSCYDAHPLKYTGELDSNSQFFRYYFSNKNFIAINN